MCIEELTMSLISLRKNMRTSAQTDKQSIFEHGLSVARYYQDLYNHVHHKTPLKYQWKLPFW